MRPASLIMFWFQGGSPDQLDIGFINAGIELVSGAESKGTKAPVPIQAR
jgi:hypothetical protein